MRHVSSIAHRGPGIGNQTFLLVGRQLRHWSMCLPCRLATVYGAAKYPIGQRKQMPQLMQ